MAPKCAMNVHPVAKVAVNVVSAVVKAVVNVASVVVNAARQTPLPAMPMPQSQQ